MITAKLSVVKCFFLCHRLLLVSIHVMNLSGLVVVTAFATLGEQRRPVINIIGRPRYNDHVITTKNIITTNHHQHQDQKQSLMMTTTRIESFWSLFAKKKKTKDDDGDNHDDIRLENEWGIPLSSTLPPLVKMVTTTTTKRRQRPLRQLPNGGRVTLLGSGPGDPGLLTVKAYNLLTNKDDIDNTVVIADRLVSNEILQLISCPIKVARKLPGCADLAQEEIYWWCYQALNQGKHVIRLKIGDPYVFGRGGEEVLQFRRFGIEPTVVPGVSAAFSAPLLGNIPVTHRGASNQVVMCTGYGREGTSPDLIKYHKEQTVVFLMAVGRLRELTNKLQTMANYPSSVPVAIVEKAGCPQQRTVIGDISTIATLAEQYNVQPPSTIIVGDVVRVLWDDILDDDDDEKDYTYITKQESNIMELIQNFTTTTA